jgi:hypothetical protein
LIGCFNSSSQSSVSGLVSHSPVAILHLETSFTAEFRIQIGFVGFGQSLSLVHPTQFPALQTPALPAASLQGCFSLFGSTMQLLLLKTSGVWHTGHTVRIQFPLASHLPGPPTAAQTTLSFAGSAMHTALFAGLTIWQKVGMQTCTPGI